MLSHTLTCPTCLHPYTPTIKLPGILPNCGHTLCNPCLVDLISKPSAKCPLDDQPLDTNSVFPVNIVLRDLMDAFEGQDQKKQCAPQEQGSEEIFSLQKDELETSCGLVEGRQKNSLDELMSDAGSEVNEQALFSETVFDEQQKELEAALDERRTNLNQIIEEKFQELATLLQRKRVNLALTLEAFFRKEKQRLSSLFSHHSPHERPSNYRELMTPDSQILSLLEDQVEQFTAKLDSTVLKKQVRSLKKKLSGISDSMSEILTSQVDIAAQFGVNSRIFAEKLETIYPTAEEEPSSVSSLSSKCLKLETSLEFEACEGCLEVTATGRPAKITVISTEDWLNIGEVRLKIDSATGLEEDLKTLARVWTELEHVDCVRIDGSFQKGISEARLTGLFKTIFGKPHLLREIEVNLQETMTGNESLVYLLESILPRALSLKSLNLNLANTNLADSFIQALTKRSLPSLSALENLTLYLGNSALPEQSLTQLFVKLPTIKNLDLCLSSTRLGDAGLKAFSETTLASIESLENLALRLWKTSITDEGAKELFRRIPDVQSFTLDLGSNRITDQGVEELVNVRLPAMRNLENFELRLYDTEVTEHIVGQIYQVKRSLIN